MKLTIFEGSIDSRVGYPLCSVVALALLFFVMLSGQFGCSSVDTVANKGEWQEADTKVSDAELSDSQQTGTDLGDVSIEPPPGKDEGTQLDIPEKTDVAPEPGEFGYPCTEDSDCLDGFCAPSPNGRVCTTTCIEDCPSGWECMQLELPGSDPTLMCLNREVNLCRPCEDHSDCREMGGAEGDRCTNFGDLKGSFCALDCSADKKCPEGYGCESMVEEGTGLDIEQCLPLSAECSCSAWSTQIAASTLCNNASCVGERRCTSEGLSDCSAAATEEELCDEGDNDCDGLTDEDFTDAGFYTSDDHCGSCGNGCVDAFSGGTGQCGLVNSQPECVLVECDTGFEEVQPGVCELGGEGQCDTCTKDDDCPGWLQCTTVGDPSTGGEFCLLPCDDDASVCSPGFSCTELPDVTGKWCALETGGCGYAGKDCSKDWMCEDLNPCTVSTCDGDSGCTFSDLQCDDNNICTTDSCDPASGCVHAPVETTQNCDDGDGCTEGDTCANSACVGTAVPCSDDLGCTEDVCNELSSTTYECVHTVSAGTCLIGSTCYDDGDLNPGNDCSMCDSGMNHQVWMAAPTGQDCDDGSFCTLGDRCVGGQCEPETSRDCDAEVGDACNLGICNEVSDACELQAKGSETLCDADGDGCTQGDSCLNGSCQSGTAPDCADGLGCTDDQCLSAGADSYTCEHAVQAGNCLINDVCIADNAENPDNQCQTCVSSVSQGVWVSKVEGTECNDGSTCTENETCTSGECSGTVLGTCAPGLSADPVACGNCGTRVDMCNATCQWETGACVNEGCAPGAQDEEVDNAVSCGNCGLKTQKRTRVCSGACEWGDWSAWTDTTSCAGQGVCTPDTTEDETQTGVVCGDCGTKSQERIRTCSSQCAWGTWGGWVDTSGCDGQGCNPGNSYPENCVNGGTQTVTCNDSCQWVTGECTGQGCTPGTVSDPVGCIGNCGSYVSTCNENFEWVAGECTGATCEPGDTYNDTSNCVYGGHRVYTCNDYCSWTAGACKNEGVCEPGEEGLPDSCGNCGSMFKTCEDDYQWGPYSDCTGQGCSPGLQENCSVPLSSFEDLGNSCFKSCTYTGYGTRSCSSQCNWGKCDITSYGPESCEIECLDDDGDQPK